MKNVVKILIGDMREKRNICVGEIRDKNFSLSFLKLIMGQLSLFWYMQGDYFFYNMEELLKKKMYLE